MIAGGTPLRATTVRKLVNAVPRVTSRLMPGRSTRLHASCRFTVARRGGRTSLGCHPRLICHIARSHELLDQRSSLRMIPIVFNDEQCGFHYTVSASTYHTR